MTTSNSSPSISNKSLTPAERAPVYQSLVSEIEALIEGEEDLVANLANIAACLKEAFDFLWVGFYWVKDKQLVLGPFQGPVACTRIAFDRGVCGRAYRTKKTLVVPNVHEFVDHIACSSAANSEIVVPILNPTCEVLGVLDVDSSRLNDFGPADAAGLEAITGVLQKRLV